MILTKRKSNSDSCSRYFFLDRSNVSRLMICPSSLDLFVTLLLFVIISFAYIVFSIDFYIFAFAKRVVSNIVCGT